MQRGDLGGEDLLFTTSGAGRRGSRHWSTNYAVGVDRSVIVLPLRWWMLMMPCRVNSTPLRALRWALLQSNMPTPWSMPSRMLTGADAPSGSGSVRQGCCLTTSVISYITSAGSLTDKLLMALPSAPAAAMVLPTGPAGRGRCCPGRREEALVMAVLGSAAR